ncbi:MAG: T9SS type A sorting domain-containing protein [bacterium]|nr:T9SS type A sorting domain-containing protein [bacterium]
MKKEVLLTLMAITFIWHTGSSSAGTFGRQTPGTSQILFVGSILGCKFTCPENCTPQSLTAFFVITGDYIDINAQCAIYDANLNLVVATEERTFNNLTDDDGWYTFSISSSPALTGGAEYWLCTWQQDKQATQLSISCADGAPDQMLKGKGGYNYPNWPSTMGVEFYTSKELCIYCSYEPLSVECVRSEELNFNLSSIHRTITFSIPEPGYTELILYDIAGRVVKNLVDRYLEKGSHRVSVSSCIPSGIYFAVLKVGKIKISEKVVLF